MASPLLIAKAAAALVSDEQGRKSVGWMLAAILSPIIVVAALLCSLGSGAAEHNASVVELCFNGGTIPNSIPAEYRAHIVNMRNSLSRLDGCIAEINEQAEEGASLDAMRVKAVYFTLYFGTSGAQDCRQFADCFVTYEERVRTTDDDGSEEETEETYTAAVPIDDLDVVYSNLASALGTVITEEQKSNANAVYELIRNGQQSGGGWSGNLGDIVMSVDGFVSPLGSGWRSLVTSEFGSRICPYHGREIHSGLDMGVPANTPIRAALSGTVITSTFNSSYGNYTMIDHGNGLTTAYAHQALRMVAVGDKVEAGDIIGLVGSTGNATGPHLHLEVRVNGELQNPRNYLP